MLRLTEFDPSGEAEAAVEGVSLTRELGEALS